MTAKKALVPTPPAEGLNALIEQSNGTGCFTASRPYLKATDNEAKTVYFIRPDCKSWSCEFCAERRRRLWIYYANYGGDRLLSQGLELSFVTLTSHRNIRSINAGIKVWRSAWPKLSTRWRRASPGLQYCYAAEHGKLGHFHVHIITSATLPTRWYKDNAAGTGLGYQAKAVPILVATECGAYIGKYLGKAIAVVGWPPYWRRINTSRKWPKPEEPETPYEWSYLGNHSSKVKIEATAYRRLGWTVATSLKELDTF